MKRTSTESLQIELVTKNDAQKESLVEGVQICEGGSISASVYMDGGVQIRGGSKSAVTPAQNVRDSGNELY